MARTCDNTSPHKVSCSKEKTDIYFVTTTLCIGMLGLVMVYYGKIINTVWEKADYTQLRVQMMLIDQSYSKKNELETNTLEINHKR